MRKKWLRIEKLRKLKNLSNANLRITKRELAVMQFVHEFGFCEIKHIMKFINRKKSASYRLMQRLIDLKMMAHQIFFDCRHGVYWLTPMGAKHSDLKPLKTIPLYIYNHQLNMIDIYFYLKEKYPNAQFISERRLMQKQFKKDQHIADGHLLIDDRCIAIEVELTRKKISRVEKILKIHGHDLTTDEVWYFCSPPVHRAMQALTQSYDYVKLFEISQVLA